MTSLDSRDLSNIERIVLAVLGSGIVPSSVAHDRTFRLDYLCAKTLAALQGLPSNTYLTADGAATPELTTLLTNAVYDLVDKGVLAVGGPPAGTVLPVEGQPAVPPSDRSRPVNFDQHPTVFDRYLAGRCLDELLRNSQVYAFIMSKYADSSEVWQRVYKQYT